MGTDVTYNGVKLKNVTTRQWEQEAVYDASGTDLLFFRHKMRFEGIVHRQSNDGSWYGVPAAIHLESSDPAASVTGSNAADGAGAFGGADPPYSTLSVQGTATTDFEEIRRRLGTPRNTLVVTIGGATVFTCGSINTPGVPAANRDLDNGPKTRDVSILAIVSDKLFRVAFSIECAADACGSGSQTAVLNNRWALIESIDDNFFVTQTIRGRIRFAQGVAVTGDDFRRLVVPRQEAGFRRERIEYSVAENGLDCDYQVVDRQTTTAAPWPASRISGTYTESCGEQGIEWFSDIQVRLDAHPGADRRLLLTRIVQIVEARLKYIEEMKKDGKKAIVLEGMQIVEHLGDANAVEGHVRLRRTLQEVDTHTWLGLLRTQTLGKELVLDGDVGGHGYKANESRTPGVYGYESQGNEKLRTNIGLYLAHCFLQTPCNDTHYIGQNWSTPPTLPPVVAQGTSIVEVGNGQISEDNKSLLSADAKTTVYTMGVAESVYHVNHMRVQLPLAGDSDDTAADTSFVAVLSGGQCQREIRYEAEKVGEMPEIPKPVSTYTRDGLKGTLLKHRIRFHPPTLLSGGKDICFRVHAYYLYAMNRPPTESDVLATVSLPTQKFVKTDYPMDLSAVYSEELGP